MTTRYVKGLKAEHPSKRLGVAESGLAAIKRELARSGHTSDTPLVAPDHDQNLLRIPETPLPAHAKLR